MRDGWWEEVDEVRGVSVWRKPGLPFGVVRGELEFHVCELTPDGREGRIIGGPRRMDEAQLEAEQRAAGAFPPGAPSRGV